jgi:hypothetical protein
MAAPFPYRAMVAISTHLVLEFSEGEDRGLFFDGLARVLPMCGNLPENLGHFEPVRKAAKAYLASRSSSDEFRLRQAVQNYHRECAAVMLDHVERQA